MSSDFYIPRPAATSDQVGVRRLITSFDLAANGHGDLIGQQCHFTVSADNGDSVHLDNYAVLVTGGVETDVLDTESAPNVTTTTLEIDTLTIGIDDRVLQRDAARIRAQRWARRSTSRSSPTALRRRSPRRPLQRPPPRPPQRPPPRLRGPPRPPTRPPPPARRKAHRHRPRRWQQPTTTAADVSTTTALATSTTSGPLTSTDLGSTTTVPPVTDGTLPFTGPSSVVSLAWSAAALMLVGGSLVVAARPRGRHARA